MSDEPSALARTPFPLAEDMSAIVERIQALARSLRERGAAAPDTCEQIETLAATILTASPLRDPTNRRAQQLADLLGHLERRIQAMLADATANDPLAALMALSDEERIALFT